MKYALVYRNPHNGIEVEEAQLYGQSGLRQLAEQQGRGRTAVSEAYHIRGEDVFATAQAMAAQAQWGELKTYLQENATKVDLLR